MTDPVSVAASVAALISLGAATSTLFYQFTSSIIDAPQDVHAITSSLYGVNIALCQIQRLLLDLTYVSQTRAADLNNLEGSISGCVKFFNIVHRELQKVCSATAEQVTIKRVWHQVKYVFQKEKVRGALTRLESEKSTLQIVMNALDR